CLQAETGKLIWKRNILSDNGAPLLSYGMASSPFVTDKMVVVQAGGPSGKSVAAYDRQSGLPLWKALNDPAAYSSPMAFTPTTDSAQLLVVTAERAVGLDYSGKLLWTFPWVVNLGNRNIA